MIRLPATPVIPAIYAIFCNSDFVDGYNIIGMQVGWAYPPAQP